MTMFMSASGGGRRGGGVRARWILAATLLCLSAAAGLADTSSRPARAETAAGPGGSLLASAEPLPMVGKPFEKPLTGLGTRDTVALLGSPSATEERPPARVWRYERGGCRLSVYFFMDMTSNTFRALSYDMTTTQDARDDHEQCFASLLDHDRLGYGAGSGGSSD